MGTLASESRASVSLYVPSLPKAEGKAEEARDEGRGLRTERTRETGRVQAWRGAWGGRWERAPVIYTRRCRCRVGHCVSPGREGGLGGLILLTATREVVPPSDVAGQSSHPGLPDVRVTTHRLATGHVPLAPLSAELENNEWVSIFS